MSTTKVIAVHAETQDAGGFSRRWLSYANSLGHQAIAVNGYAPDLHERLQGCDALLWHLSQDKPADLEFARSILYAAEQAGLRVFPNHATCWHFDDKIAQAKLLESVGAPLARTWVFFTRKEGLQFLARARYPLVFKLRRGAGSINVRLVKDRFQGERLVRRMFGHGVVSRPPVEVMSRTLARARRRGADVAPWQVRLRRVLKRGVQWLLHPPRERGYALFQELVPGNDHDLRVTVIGERVFAFRRNVRPNDFRASGSGRLVHLQQGELPRDAMEVALGLSRRLGFQSMAYDFVRDPVSRKPVLLEVSYVFVAQYIHDCYGYLEAGTHWCEGHFWPEHAILDDLLR